MKLAIMQPYFLPYLGYFSLFYHADEFVFFDTPQYTKKSWYERNRIIKLQGGHTYIKVPLEKVFIGTPINNVKVDNTKEWKRRILSQLEVYKKAPYYKDVMTLLSEVFINDYEYLYLLNIDLIKEILSYLNIDRKIHIFSELNIEIDVVSAPDEWALNISKAMGAKTYINSPGGEDFFDKDKYHKLGIELMYAEQPLIEYSQIQDIPFEKGLSIIDIILFNKRSDIVAMLNSSKLRG